MEARYITTTDTAKMIRAALKEAFAGITFSVRSSNYSGGSSIRVGWSDGPNTAQVDAIVKRFAGSTFDGMQDLKSSVATVINGEPVHFCADYVFTSREYSDGAVQRAIDAVCRLYDVQDDVTVAAFRRGALWGVRVADTDVAHLIHQRLSKHSDRLVVGHSPTAAAVGSGAVIAFPAAA